MAANAPSLSAANETTLPVDAMVSVCLRTAAQICPGETTTTSSDATLRALALSGVTLDQNFAPATEDYTATVVNSVMQTTVTATTAHSGATVALNYGDDTSLTNPVTLAVGANVIKAVVTAEDTTTPSPSSSPGWAVRTSRTP